MDIQYGEEANGVLLFGLYKFTIMVRYYQPDMWFQPFRQLEFSWNNKHFITLSTWKIDLYIEDNFYCFFNLSKSPHTGFYKS